MVVYFGVNFSLQTLHVFTVHRLYKSFPIIKQRLATRDLMDELRNRGEITGGPPPFNKKDVRAFADALDRFLAKWA